MRLDDRRQQILDLLVERGSVALDELAARFDVSKMTIHRDLDELERSGSLRKIRGGATIESSAQFESDFRFRERRAASEKQLIARAAVELVEPGMSVIIDDSSTASLIAPLLVEKRPLTVITNGLATITLLAPLYGITLIALGGNYAHKFNGFTGLVTERALADLRADVVFLSSSGIDGLRAFHQDQEIVRVKARMFASARQRYLLSDNAKFGRTALHFLADLTDFDAVITGADLPTETVSALRAAGVRLTLAADTVPLN